MARVRGRRLDPLWGEKGAPSYTVRAHWGGQSFERPAPFGSPAEPSVPPATTAQRGPGPFPVGSSCSFLSIHGTPSTTYRVRGRHASPTPPASASNAPPRSSARGSSQPRSEVRADSGRPRLRSAISTQDPLGGQAGREPGAILARPSGKTRARTPRPTRPPPSQAPPSAWQLLRRLAGRPEDEGRYRTEGEIARGGQGAVLRVWDEDLQRHLAMKVILGDRPVSAERRRSPRRTRRSHRAVPGGSARHRPARPPGHRPGARAGARRAWPRVLHDEARERAGASAPSSNSCARAGKAGTGRAPLDVILKVCEALAFAHSKGVIHRDIQAGERDGRGVRRGLYVMDWGPRASRRNGGPQGPPARDRFSGRRTRVSGGGGLRARVAPAHGGRRRDRHAGLHGRRSRPAGSWPPWGPRRTSTPRARCCTSSLAGARALRAARDEAVADPDLDSRVAGIARALARARAERAPPSWSPSARRRWRARVEER